MEAVYIATPNSLHADNCRLCLEHGKHVLCEKPFTLRAEQAQQLYQLAAQKHLFLMEALWTRPAAPVPGAAGAAGRRRAGAGSKRSTANTASPHRSSGGTGSSTPSWAAAHCWTSASITWDFYSWSPASSRTALPPSSSPSARRAPMLTAAYCCITPAAASPYHPDHWPGAGPQRLDHMPEGQHFIPDFQHAARMVVLREGESPEMSAAL